MYVTVAGTLGAAPQVPPPTADQLFAQRDDLSHAERAAAIWRQAAATDVEAAWKLARVEYWIGGHAATEAARRAALERGVDDGARAVALAPGRPEGYFWRAANMGALAESFGIMQGLKYRGRIKSDLETVLKMDPAWQDGSADRALGRWYDKVPGLFGGSDKEAEAHYRASLTYKPDSTASLYFLAELLLDKKRTAEARPLLQQVIDAPIDPDWAPEDREFKALARKALAALAIRPPATWPAASRQTT